MRILLRGHLSGAARLLLPAALALLILLVSIGEAAAQSPVASPTPGTTTFTPTATATLSPAATAAATATATPLPAPIGIQVKTSVILGGEDGMLIHPSQRTATNHVTWTAIAGFTGSYEVERAIADAGWAPVTTPFERVATVAATSAVDGELEYTEDVPFGESAQIQRCFRVRAVSDTQASAYSQQARTQLAVRSGGEEPSPAATATPLPPVVGTGPGTASAGSVWPLLAGLTMLLASALALLGVRRRTA